jgi:hypothetical protein
MTPDTHVKVRENRLRRKALRRGLRLTKSFRRDPYALDYGLFALVDMRTDALVNPSLYGHPHAWTLDVVEDYLAKPGGD